MWWNEDSSSTDFSLWVVEVRKFARTCARWFGRGLKYSEGGLGELVGRISGPGGGGEDPQTEVCATEGRAARKCFLFVAFALLFGVAPVRATTYFVAAGGSDSNNGTNGATPWQTVAKVNGAAFSPGDSILFNRGDAWYGTSLVVPSSGSSGAPITFGAYGSGANPMLKGSTFLTTGGFTLAPNLIATVFSLHDSGTFSNDSLTRNWREQIGHVQITNSVISLTVTVTASASAALNITGAAIGPVTTAPNTSAMTRITWGGGNNGTTVGAGTSATSDVITYSLDNSVDQIVAIYTMARNVEYYGNNNTTLWSDNTAADQSQSANVTGLGFASGGNSVVGAITGTIQTAVTYRAALGTAPVAVWENGALLPSKNSQSAVEAAAGSWFYDGTFLYLHASDSSNVASNGKTYSYVTAASPSFIAWDNGKSWLIFDSIDESETYNSSTATLGGLYLTGSNSIVRNLSLHDTYRHPLTIYIGAANNLVTNVTAYHAYGTSPLAIYGPGTTGNLVQNSTFFNDTSLSSAYLPAGVWAVIVAHGGSTNNTVDSCLIYSTAPSPGGYGILVGDAGTAVTFSHNFVYGTYAYGVDVGSGGGDGLGNGASLTLWDNLLDISQASNVGILLTGSVGSIVYDNTVYGPSNTNAAISQASTSTGALVKNNIFYAGAYASVDASSEAGTVYDYNDYFSAAGTPFSWGGTAYALSGWQTNAVQDAHSFSADPGLVNAS